MKKAVIFDLDGVISNTDKTRFLLLQDILQNYGLSLNDADYKNSIGKRTRHFLTEKFGSELSEKQIDDIVNLRKNLFLKNPENYIVELPSVYETCKQLSDKYILAIASASDTKVIELILNQLKIDQFFSVVVSVDEVEKSKPAPDVYLRCLEKLNLKPFDCIAIEDSPVGIQAAQSAGIQCIAVTYTHKSEELKNADFIINDLNQIANILKD